MVQPNFVTYEKEISQLLNSIVVPRPVAFVTSMNAEGVVNAAPFSYFNVVSKVPPLVSLSIQKRNEELKDSTRNILLLKEFVINICSPDLTKAIVLAAEDFPSDVSEVEVAKLPLISSLKISVPRISNTMVQMECILHQRVPIEQGDGDILIGKVVNVHLNKMILDDKGRIIFEKLNPIARLAGTTYAELSHYFDVQVNKINPS